MPGLRPVLATLLLAVGAALVIASTALAKGQDVTATLDAALPVDAQPGEQLEIGWTLTVNEDGGSVRPFIAERIFVRLLPASGDPIEFPARRDRVGHYLATITVPDGGIGAVEIGLAGTVCTADGQCARGDEMFTLADPPAFAADEAGAAPPPAGQAAADVDTQPSTAPGASLLPLALAVGAAALGAGLIARRGALSSSRPRPHRGLGR
jgi:hypothetical protein